MGAILAHKGLAAFALGSALRQSGSFSKGWIAAFALFFATCTPLGVTIGMLVSHTFNPGTVAFCTAIAAGTFLQVSIMEIIPTAFQVSPEDSQVTRALRCV